MEITEASCRIAQRNTEPTGQSSAAPAVGDRLRALVELSRALSSSLEVGATLTAITRVATEISSPSFVSLWEADEAREELTVVAASNEAMSAEFQSITRRFGQGILGEVARTRQAISVPDFAVEPRIAFPDWFRRHGLRSYYSIPIVFQDSILGVLNVARPQPLPPGDELHGILACFANHAAVVLKNAKLHEASEARRQEAETNARVAQRRAQNLETLARVTQAISGATARDEVFGVITRSALELLDAKLVRLWVRRPGTQELVVASSWGVDPGLETQLTNHPTIQIGTGLIGRIAESNTPEFIADIRTDERTLNRELVRRLDLASMAGIPLAVGDTVVGVLSVLAGAGRSFGSDDQGLLKIFGDQTAIAIEQSRLYEDITAKSAHLEQQATALQAKNAELDSFAHIVSHDLKAPLVAIEGMSRVLLSDYAEELDADGRRYLERVCANVGFMSQLIQDLLALARVGREARPPESVVLDEVVDTVLEELGERITARGIRLVRHPLGMVWGIRTQLVQVFTNLISNAVKYIGDTPAPTVTIRMEDRGDRRQYAVTDNGVGIDPAYHDKVFEMFHRLKDVDVEGTGVGLPIVKKIVEAAGGRIGIESAKGRGSTFYFTWPRGE